MIHVEFHVEGTPAPQPRPRVRATRDGRLGVCNPDTATGWKQRVACAGRAAWRAAPLEEAIEVDLLFLLPRPKSHLRADGGARRSSPRYPAGKPDRDNLEKAALDALNGIVWRDDAQVVGGYCSKRYVDALQSSPGLHVVVRTVE